MLEYVYISSTIIFLVIIFVFVWRWTRKISFMMLPDIADCVFIAEYRQYDNIPDDIILRERDYIAKKLGINAQKLSPSITFEKISELDLTGYNSGIGELYDDLFDLSNSEEKDFVFPKTVGELICELYKLKSQK